MTPKGRTRPTASRSSSPRSATATPTSTSWTPTARTSGGSSRPRATTAARSSRPTARRIIYRSDRKGNDNLQVFINNVEGTAEKALTDNDTVNWGPYFHPDGRHIIYATGRHGHANYELYLMDVETGKEERITFREGFDGLPVFSPDGKKLMWTSSGRDADRKSQLFIADFEMGPTSTAFLPMNDGREVTDED